MSVSLTYQFGIHAAETLETGIAGVTQPVITYDAYNETGTLGAATTPAVSKIAEFLLTLTAGAATINLAALTGANGTVDLTTPAGLRVQLLRIKNLGANPMTFAEGASNGIALACLPLIVPAGTIVQIYLADVAPDIAAADRTIDVTGTTTQTAEISIVAG